MTNLLLKALLPLNDQIDPKVTPNGNAPWMPALRDVAGMILVTCIVLLVIVLIVGVALAVSGKLTQMHQAQSAGWMIILWSLIGAAAMGSASGLVFWGTSITLANNPRPAAAGQILVAAGTLLIG